MAPPVIVLDRVAKRFAGHTAVDALSLEVSAGLIYGLLGPNGAGKTTTIRMIMGIMEPDEGAVRLFGDETDIGAGARNQPVFLTSSLLWFKTEGQGVCGPSGDKSLIYDLSDSSETPSAIGQLRAVWPATSSNH